MEGKKEVKYKGRRVSKNIEDMTTKDGRSTLDHQVDEIRKTVVEAYTAGKKQDRVKEKTKTIEQIIKNDSRLRPKKIQVTPGKWKTKGK